MDAELSNQVARRESALSKVREMLVRQLELERDPDEIDPDTPLFASGLGLDSLDAVELIVSLDVEFQVKVSEGTSAVRTLRTVNSLVDLVLAEAGHGA